MNEILIAWLLPLLAGTGLWQLVLGRARSPAQWAGILGYGYLIGMLLTGTVTAVLSNSDTHHALRHAGPTLLVLALTGWGWSWRPRSALVTLPIRQPLQSWQALLFFVLAILLLLRAAVLTDEVWLRPTFPWDAWSAWAVKPKSWYLLGYGEKYVSASVWLKHAESALRTTPTWHYPTLLGWIQVWFASAAGEWNEPMVNLPWVGIWIALLLASYAQMRTLGLTPLRAMVATYVLGSLPLLNAHVALAGYADLWLATLFGLAILVWLLWLQQHRPIQLIAAVALGCCLPAIKLEGVVWMVCFFASVFLSTLPSRARCWLLIAIFALGALGMGFGGFELPVPGLGWVRLAWGEIDIPAMGTWLLQWHSVSQEMFASLYSLPNWHLLWFLAPIIVVLRWREFLRNESVLLLGALLLLCCLFLFVLFFFTQASRWAEDFTSANRLIMHITPAVVTLLALLLRDAPCMDQEAPKLAARE